MIKEYLRLFSKDMEISLYVSLSWKYLEKAFVGYQLEITKIILKDWSTYSFCFKLRIYFNLYNLNILTDINNEPV